MKPERVVKKFYEGLEEGVIYARKCKECGAIEFPPRYACNTCGYHETEWTTITGMGYLESFVLPGPMTVREELAAMGDGDYCFGEVRLDEGPSINAVIFGVPAKKADELYGRLPLRVKPRITQRPEGYKILYFELAED